jgi:hypothetical protein
MGGTEGGKEHDKPPSVAPPVHTLSPIIGQPNKSNEGINASEEAKSPKQIHGIAAWAQRLAEPMTLLTLILAFATVGLFCSTWELVTDTRRSAEKQLRAYVFADQNITIGLDAGNHIVTGIPFKNFGQTPASDFKRWICAALLEAPLNSTLPDSDEKLPPSIALLAPTQSTWVIGRPPICGSSPKDRALTADEKNEFTEGKKVIYIYGMAIYKDAFGVDRWTRFRIFSRNGTIAFPEEGNGYY